MSCDLCKKADWPHKRKKEERKKYFQQRTLFMKLLQMHVIPFTVIPIRSYTLLRMDLLGLEASSEVLL